MQKDECFTLRHALAQDLSAVAALYRSVLGQPGCVWNELYPTLEDAEQDLQAGGLYVYETNGRIVGAVSVVSENELDELDCWHSGNAREIARVVIAKDYQGRRLSQAMLEDLFEILKAQSCAAIHLLAAISNPAAVKTYERLGFRYLAECEMYESRYFAGEKLL